MTDNSIRFCARCGKEIVGRNARAKYCSERCRVDSTCSIPGCGRKSYGHSLCQSHAARVAGEQDGEIARRTKLPPECKGLARRWGAMHRRCEVPNTTKFELYGGRGIRVCSRWDDFFCFVQDMGMAPSDRHSIDRIDPDGDYEPGNCRWATPLEQIANSSRFRLHREYVDTVTILHAAGKTQREIAAETESARTTVVRALRLSGVIPDSTGVHAMRNWCCTPTENAAHAR